MNNKLTFFNDLQVKIILRLLIRKEMLQLNDEIFRHFFKEKGRFKLVKEFLSRKGHLSVLRYYVYF